MARKMKDSGVPWIGEIPVDWVLSKVSRFYKIQLGKMLQPAQKADDDTFERYLCAANVGQNNLKTDDIKQMWFSSQEKELYNIRPGDLLVVEGGDVASSDIVSVDLGDVYFQNSLHRVRSTNGYDVRFLRFWLIAAKACGYIDLICNKATIAHFSKEKFSALPFPVISISEQMRIVEVLDLKCAKIDSMIEKTRTSIEEYKKLKQAIIIQAVTKGVRGDRPMKESGIEWTPTIPINWNIIPSKRLFADSDEKKHLDDELLTASQKYGVISQRQYMEREKARVVLATQGIENWKHVEPYDFIISLRSFQGGLEMSEVSGCITWHYIVLKPLKPIHSFYFKWLFKSELYIKALQRTCNFIRDGQDLRYSNFVQVPLFLPPLDEQKEIADALNARCAEIDALIQKKILLVSELESYKKSLIHEYVTGKKEVQQNQQTKEVVVYPFFPAGFQASSPRFAQAVLMSRVLDACRIKMGRVKLEKMMFVLENSIGFNFETEYVREAAGPLDKSIYVCENIISKRNKWFTIRKSPYGVSYQPTEDINKYKKYYDQYFSDYADSIDRIISVFRDFNSDQAEIIATLYGAWNDFIIDQKSYTDDDIVEEVLHNWNDTKKRFSKDIWLRAIQRMRKLGLVPQGYGRHTIIKEENNLG